jgi:hypothetical protein
MCSPDKLPCKNAPGSPGKVLKEAQIWITLLSLLLTPLCLPYLLHAFFSRCYHIVVKKFNFWPLLFHNLPSPLPPTPGYVSSYFLFFRQPVYLATIIYLSVTFWFKALYAKSSLRVKHLTDEEFTNIFQYSSLVIMLERQTGEKEEKEGTTWHLRGGEVFQDIADKYVYVC